MTEMIVNERNDKGAVLCPVCGKPATWVIAKEVRYTSPMRRVRVRNIDALVHECCLRELYASMGRQLKRALFWSNIRSQAAAAWKLTTSFCRLVGWCARHPFEFSKILIRRNNGKKA